MENLLPAIKTKISGSALSSDVSSRIFLDEYPADEQPATFPYGIYSVVAGNPDDAFSKKGQNFLLQFSIFSSSQSAAEIAAIYKDLRSLFDDCSMTITGSSLIWCRWTGLSTMSDQITTAEGISSIKHWAVEYEISLQDS